ncbi:NERD domain-containing protein [Streptomyces glaucosporus]|uniref:NERD domain-containing protein n=1 Tax=Streptomyces glaucosporus TaxID=284044 RepID=A0ABP5UYC2_9ACTN
MSELRVSPWKRYGHDRLYVNLPDGTSVAWYDRKTGRLDILVEEYRTRALDALAPHLPWTGAPTPAAGSPPLSPAEDLASNRPGEALRAKVAELAPRPWLYALTRLLGRKSEADSWRAGLKGEQIVGAELERMTASGWRVLHSIPLPGDKDIDHLLIGPGGVFSVNTKRHPGARVWVGDDSVRIGGRTYPYVRRSRNEAGRASRVLTEGCGFPVDVRPVLVFVDTAEVTKVATLLDVGVYEDRTVSALGPLTGVLAPSDVERIHATARNRRTWARA